MSLWGAPIRAFVPGKFDVDPTGLGLRGEPLRLVCCEQNSSWKTNDGSLSCGRHKDLPRKWRHGWRYDHSDQQVIRKRRGTNNPPRESTRLPGDGAVLTRAGQGKNRYDRLSEENTGQTAQQIQGQGNHTCENYILEVKKATCEMSNRDTQAFHTIVEKSSFLWNWYQFDILTAKTFITTRVIDSNEGEDKKLGRILKYISGMRDLVLNLESDRTRMMKCWMAAEFAVHQDMKSHTGWMILMGKGALYSASNKHKLNT